MAAVAVPSNFPPTATISDPSGPGVARYTASTADGGYVLDVFISLVFDGVRKDNISALAGIKMIFYPNPTIICPTGTITTSSRASTDISFTVSCAGARYQG